jgi:hypothetical protein
MEEKRRIKYNADSYSPLVYTRKQVQRLADKVAKQCNKRDRVHNFWHGIVFASCREIEGELYWRYHMAGGLRKFN